MSPEDTCGSEAASGAYAGGLGIEVRGSGRKAGRERAHAQAEESALGGSRAAADSGGRRDPGEGRGSLGGLGTLWLWTGQAVMPASRPGCRASGRPRRQRAEPVGLGARARWQHSPEESPGYSILDQLNR